MDLRTLFYKTFLSSILVFFLSIVAILVVVETLLRNSKKEGLALDHLQLAIQSIRSAQKDSRLNASQKQALQNALYYAEHIKNL